MLRERVQCILTNNDYERVEECLKRFGASKVYLCYNEHPWETLRNHVKELELKTLDIMRKCACVTEQEESRFRNGLEERFRFMEDVNRRRMSYKTDRVEWVPVDYYDFDNSLVVLYDLAYSEYLRGRDVIISINGGIRLTAVAASFVAGLLPNCHLVYFFSSQWGLSPEGGISSLIKGKEPVKITPIFNISSVVPSNDEDVLTLIALLKNEKEASVCRSVKRIVSYITQNLLGTRISKTHKVTKSQIAKYTNKLKTLMKDGLVCRDGNIIKLTDSGKLVAKLVERKFNRDRELGKHEITF